MKKTEKRIDLDFSRKGSSRIVFACEKDRDSRQINVHLFDGGKKYIVPQNYIAAANYMRSDGKSAAYDAEILSDGSISIVIPYWALDVSGETKCSISIYNSNKGKLTSASFTIEVEKALYIGTDIATDGQYNMLIKLVSDVAAVNEVEAKRVEAEGKRVEAENLRNEAEATREKNEDDRKAAELIREAAEKERESRDVVRDDKEAERNLSEEERKENEEARIEAENERERTILRQNARIEEVFGLAGEVEIKISGWIKNSYSAIIPTLRDEDAVMITPATVEDKIALECAGLFVVPEVSGGVVNMTVDTLPTVNIKLLYFITRGGFGDGNSNALGDG